LRIGRTSSASEEASIEGFKVKVTIGFIPSPTRSWTVASGASYRRKNAFEKPSATIVELIN
jgi:hypothetical protein